MITIINLLVLAYPYLQLSFFVRVKLWRSSSVKIHVACTESF